MGTFVVFTTDRGRRFSLVSNEGTALALSQTYRTLASCKGGIGSVRVCAPGAGVEDQTGQSFRPLKCPKYQVYLDANECMRFRLLAKNGQAVLTSDAYDSMEACLAGIEEVRRAVADAETVIEE